MDRLARLFPSLPAGRTQRSNDLSQEAAKADNLRQDGGNDAQMGKRYGKSSYSGRWPRNSTASVHNIIAEAIDAYC